MNWNPFRRPTHSDISEELREHFEHLVAEHRAAGLSESDARLAARRDFGSSAQLHEECREGSPWAWFDAIALDTKHAFRGLRRSPGFAAIVILTLALGIGANAAIFTVVNAVLLRPFDYPHVDRLMILAELNTRGGRNTIAYPNLLDWMAQSKSFEAIAGYRGWNVRLTAVDPPIMWRGRAVSAGFFSLLGAKPALGRLFTPEDDRIDANGTIILTHTGWQSRFGGDPNIIGRSIPLENDGAYTVIGVLTPDFRFGSRPDEYFVPLAMNAKNNEGFRDRGNHQGLFALARRKADISPEQANIELRAIAASLARSYPLTNTGLSAVATAFHTQLTGDIRTPLYLMLGAVGFVLLIACANVANLSLARATARSRELAVRQAVGAGRRQIIRAVLLEALILAFAGAALGLALAQPSVDALLRIVPDQVPRLWEVRVDSTVMLFTLAVAFVSALAFGCAPLWQTRRLHPQDALRAGSTRSATAGPAASRIRAFLLAAEIAVVLILCTGATLLVRSLWKVQDQPLGFDPRGTLVSYLNLPKLANDAAMANFWRDLESRAAALPGVVSATVSYTLPIDGSKWGSVFAIRDQPVPERTKLPFAQVNLASPSYFRTLSIPILRGRVFSETDIAGSPPVVVINETVARLYFGDRDPIGQFLKQGWPESTGPQFPYRRIIGVVGDVKQNGLDSRINGEMYFPIAQLPVNAAAIVVRTEAPPAAVQKAIASLVREIQPGAIIERVTVMEEILDSSLVTRRFSVTLIGLFAALALLLAAIGTYGVVAYSVSQRTSEFGIRLALGARSREVLSLVVRQSLGAAAFGITLGLSGAWALSSLLENQLYGVTPKDPLSFSFAPMLLILVTILASLVPAFRATRVDPVTVLRQE